MSPKLLSPSGENVFASAKAAPVLIRDHGYRSLSVEVDADSDRVSGEKAIDVMTGAQLDAFAAELNIDGWDAKAKVPAKKQAIKDHIAKLPTGDEEPAPDGLDDLSDEQLDEKADELSVEVDADSDRETLIAAIREALAAAAE